MMNYEGQDWEGSLKMKEKPDTLSVCSFDPIATEGKMPYSLVTDTDLSTQYVLVTTGSVMYSLVIITSSDFYDLLIGTAFQRVC